MIASTGHLLIVLALLLALTGCVSSFAGLVTHRPALALWGRRAAWSVAGLVGLATALMEYALISHDFSVRYVADVGSRETPLYYTVVSLWGALEGSIVFWVFLLSAYTVAFLSLNRRRFPELQPAVTGILLGISSFFLFVVAGPGNPFGLVSPAPADGPGPNPLLQNHWMMGVHPVLLYLGYVGLAVPFAVAMASLLVGTPTPAVLQLVRRWALFPWIFLSLGIVAGMWWSYAVLGWGGYWSWDPVENASVMPWLITTAFLHSLQVQERRQMLKVWTLSLIIAAFVFSVLGTFLTRSGVLESVHSFTQSAIGPLFLGFLAAVLVASLGLLAYRSEALGAPGVLESSVCRETAFLLNNLLLVGATFTILLGTVFPLLAEAATGSKLSVGAPYFNQVNVPIGLALLFLMGVGPALPWGAARLDDLQWRFLGPVAAGVGCILLLLVLGVRGIGPLVTFGLAAFALTVTAGRFLADLEVRRGNTRESRLVAARRLFRANPRRYGGYLVHLGVLLAVVGIASSQSYAVQGQKTLAYGQSMRLDGYTLTFRGLQPRREPNRMVMEARIEVRRGNQPLGTLTPSQNYYPTLDQPVVTPGVQEQPFELATGLLRGQNPLPALGQLGQGRNPFEDLYLVLQAVNGVSATRFNPKAGSVTLQVLVNPLVGFIWLGGFVIGLGGFFALLPAARRRRVVAAVPEPAPAGVGAVAEEVTA